MDIPRFADGSTRFRAESRKVSLLEPCLDLHQRTVPGSGVEQCFAQREARCAVNRFGRRAAQALEMSYDRRNVTTGDRAGETLGSLVSCPVSNRRLGECRELFPNVDRADSRRRHHAHCGIELSCGEVCSDDGRRVVGLLATHQLEIAEQLADQILIINHGQKIFHGTMTDLRNRYPDSNGEENLEYFYSQLIEN